MENTALHQADFDIVLRWLEELGIAHYLCGQCQGIHISEVQEQDGVLESRLFIDQGCLIYSTEAEVKPSAMLPLQAELHHINGACAHLKAFLDITDEDPVRLILCDTLWLSAGITREQLQVFLANLMPVKTELLDDLCQRGFLAQAEAVSHPEADATRLH